LSWFTILLSFVQFLREIHQAHLGQFSLLEKFFNENLLFKTKLSLNSKSCSNLKVSRFWWIAILKSPIHQNCISYKKSANSFWRSNSDIRVFTAGAVLAMRLIIKINIKNLFPVWWRILQNNTYYNKNHTVNII
jgi:hypothetical protein